MAGPRVFISYANDGGPHAEQVRSLWQLLRENGIDARLDLSAAERPQDWGLWMQHEYEQADFVLVIASQAYKRRAEGTEASGKGEGVAWEARLLRAEVYSRPDWYSRVLRVVLPGGSRDDLPSFLGGHPLTHYIVDPLTTTGAERLLRYLTNQPYETEPPLGAVPRFEPRTDPSAEQAPWTRTDPTPAVFTDFERQLNLRTPRELLVRAENETTRVLVDRSEACQEIASLMTAAAAATGTLVVHGEPSVGKSVLCLQAVDLLRENGAQVVALSLRDLQPPLPALEAAVGIPLARLFGSVAAAESRLLVVDGAEAVQQGCRDQLVSLVDAAHASGLGAVVVVRDDALTAVEEALCTLSGTTLSRAKVEPLPDIGVERLVHDIPSLGRLRQRRSRWLLRRIGLVGLLLKGGVPAVLRDGALSEADVFDACWRGWVRRHEQYPPGAPSPDAREQALLDIARAELRKNEGQGRPDPSALPSLRSDGLLLPLGPGASWRSRESFFNDVVRDFATARLLLTDGLESLRSAEAPRWAIRAAGVACQAQLAGLSSGRVDSVLAELVRLFDGLATEHGARWADVPWEAVLSTGAAESVVRAATPMLLGEHGRRLRQLLSVAERRLNSLDANEPITAEPLIVWLVEQERAVRGLPHEVVEEADRVILMWLRGVGRDSGAYDDPATREVRRNVRDALLCRDDHGGDETLLEMLATLGPDIDDRTRTVLRRMAAKRPRALQRVVETADSVLSLGRHDPELLAELTTAYYIARRKRPRAKGMLSAEVVRPHKGGWTFGVPRAAWHRGPFWAMLHFEPELGITVINALLDHAVCAQAEQQAARGGEGTQETTDVLAGLDLLGLGPRRYIGDAQSYDWYRDAGTRPAPCTSALLAWERAADRMRAAGMGLRDVALTLLRGARSIAAVGVVVGFLIRHLNEVGDELDDFLAVPTLWSLESARATKDAVGLHRIPDGEDVRGSHLRKASFRDVAGVLSAKAAAAGDVAAADRLRAVGARLLEAAPRDKDGRPAVEARIWAASLDARNYRTFTADGQAGYEYTEPPELTADLHGPRRDLSRTNEMYGLQNRYALSLTPPFALGTRPVDPAVLADDVRTAGDLLDSPPTNTLGAHVDAAVAVAAAVVRTTGRGTPVLNLGDQQVLWALRVVIEEASALQEKGADGESMFTWGADRSAASALPSLLLPPFTDKRDSVVPKAELLDRATRLLPTCMASHVEEVRRVTALALRAVWTAPCGPPERQCRHRVAWQAVEEAARDIAMAPHNGTGRRADLRIEGNLPTALPMAKASDLILHRLVPALVAVTDAAGSECCVAADAERLRAPLQDAYVRTTLHWADEGYEVDEEETTMVADALLAVTGGGMDILTDAVVALGGVGAAAGDLLRGACTAATYNTARRARLRAVWPTLLSEVLDLPDSHVRGRPSYSAARAVGALIPAPAPVSYDKEIDKTVEKAHEGWLTASELAALVDRWLPSAIGSRHAVDDLIGLLRASPLDEQLALGLPWIRALAVPQSGPVVRDTYLLVDWLRSLHQSGRLDGLARRQYDVIVDSLAAAGSVSARELQQADE
ncbi:SEFIR domain-containing protein [Streptomyces sp. NPDC006906]|uniref:SEFIR domain-containing protein n=1 Tax=Streptomyces sp. NPDC006906 TaxID=3154782 RepID=UPI0033D0365A